MAQEKIFQERTQENEQGFETFGKYIKRALHQTYYVQVWRYSEKRITINHQSEGAIYRPFFYNQIYDNILNQLAVREIS